MTATQAHRSETAPIAAPRGPAGRRRVRDAALAVGGYLVAQVAFLAALRALVPRFFWLDDQQAQYVPGFGHLGRSPGVRPPLLDPELGSGGNFVADPQYGVLDPTHWLISAAVARLDTLRDAGWLLGAGATLVLGLGLVLLLVALRVRPALAAAAAVGAASTGLFLWVGGSWWPLMWGTAWLPWLWLGLVLRRWPGAVVTALAAWQLTASGYPYVLVPAGALVAGHLLEQRRRRREGRSTAPVLSRLAAGAAGLVAGAPGLLASQEMAEASTRSEPPETVLANVGSLIPNLLDAVLGGSTLTPSVSGAAGGYLWTPPLAATAVLALPALALVDWRGALRGRGVLTGMVLLGAALVLTQMPTDVGQLRYPFRYLAVSGPALAVLAAVALTAVARPTRRRVLAALGLVGAQLGLALVRSPALWAWHLLAAVLAAAAVAALALLLRRRTAAAGGALRAWLPRVAGPVLVALAVAADLAPVGSTTLAQARADEQAELPATGLPFRNMALRPAWGDDVAAFRDRSVATDTALTVYVFGGFDDVGREVQDQGWDWGVLPGNANLVAGLRPGFGYVAVGHDAWTERLCQDLFGQVQSTEECTDGLLERVPGTDLRWIDALSSDQVLLSPYAPDAVEEHFRDGGAWTEAGLAGVYGRFVRDDGLPGRVTWASDGVSVEAAGDDAAGDTAAAFRSGEPGESLRVSTPADGGRLVLRIPAWPGFRAEVDGTAVEVGSVEDTLLTIELPGDLDDARVDLYFDPLADRLLVPAAGAGVLLLALAVAVEVVVRRRRTA
ncbi:hypothetical protein ACI8AK_01630 [Geodermatophilus sp. SYSU D00867]